VRAADQAPTGTTAPLRRRDRGVPALAGFRRALRPVVRDLDARWDPVLADVDDEDLHDLRVALRRTRTLVEAGRRVLPRLVRTDLERDLRWLSRATGAARDLDVHLAHLRQVPGTADGRGAVERLLDGRAEARAELVTVLRSTRAVELRHALATWCAVPDRWVVGGRHASRPLGPVAADRMDRARRAVERDLREVRSAPSDAALHRLRRDAKRLRYLVEAFGGLGGRPRRREVVAGLQRLQDDLGRHQDAIVRRAQLASLGGPARTRVEAVGEVDGELALAAVEAYLRSPARGTLPDLITRAGR
jgi:CHAD domain-containing protein